MILALVVAHYNFITIHVCMEKNSNGEILMHSKLGKMIEANSMNVPYTVLLHL